MEVFCVHATFLDFGDNLRCMKQVAGLAGAPRNLLICRVILHKPCNLAGRACSVTGCRLTSCAMQPRRQSLLGHGLSPHKLRHATLQAKPARSRAVASQAAPCNLAGRACSVTGCHVILYKPCNLAGRACSVTGCRPIKRQSPTASYVSELPTKQREFVFLHGL